MIFTAGFSPDGTTLYAVGEVQAINLWEMLAYYWPEIGGTIVAITVLLFLIVLRRVLRTPRLPGQPHCRRCNYCLKGAASDRCPECFTPTKSPRRGRTTRRRLLPLSLLTAIMLVGYASPWIFWLPRTGWFGASLRWWSHDLEGLALKRNINLSAWRRPVGFVYAIDVIGGTVTRRFEITLTGFMLHFDITVTPDGTGLLVPLPDGLALLDARTGRTLRTLPSPVPTSNTSCFRQFVGFDDTGQEAYVVILDEAADRTRLLRWNMETNECSCLLEVKCDTVTPWPATQPQKWPHWLYKVPGGTPRFLELESGLAGMSRRDGSLSTMKARYHIFGTNNEHVFSVDFVAPEPKCGPGFSSDGARTFFLDFNAGLMPFFLASGEAEDDRALSGHGLLGHTPCDQAQIGRMVVVVRVEQESSRRRDFAVADLDSREWIGRFTSPPENGFTRIIVAPNKEFFAATAFVLKIKTATGDHLHELMIYDMRNLPEPAHAD
ncbi:MAG: hypothetical protein IT170_19490 [Bryobacterales bacterium]|nr:hypothetical protein [Bryobacterales bacterium]